MPENAGLHSLFVKQYPTMALRRGIQLLAPRLGDQGARFLFAPLCSQAANLPFHNCDDRSSVGPSGNTGFARGTP